MHERYGYISLNNVSVLVPLQTLQTLWWNLYSVTMYMSDISLRYAKLNP
jgi:hypothetical protein